MWCGDAEDAANATGVLPFEYPLAAPPDDEYDEISGAGTGEADAEKNSSGVPTRGVNDEDDDDEDNDDEYGEAVVAVAEKDEDDEDDEVGVDGANSGGRGGGSGDVETADCAEMPMAADPVP